MLGRPPWTHFATRFADSAGRHGDRQVSASHAGRFKAAMEQDVIHDGIGMTVWRDLSIDGVIYHC